MTEKLRFLRLGSVFSVHFERVSLLHMPTHYPGPVHCNTNSVTQLAVRSSPTTMDDNRRVTQVTGCFFCVLGCAVHAYSPVVLLCSVLT